MKPRVVLDTNVLVSGLLGGTATEVIRRWRAGDFNLILSAEILTEYEMVLHRPKFKLPPWVVEELLDYIREQSVWVTPGRRMSGIARDPTDDKFLEAAVAGKASLLVSGDDDLLSLGEFEGVRIITLRELLSLW